MSNSSLASFTKWSPNCSSPRRGKISGISIHCTVGELSIESLGNWFSQTKSQASSNYGIGKDGRIGQYVDERNRSWCSSSAEVDNRVVTIEVASKSYDPYEISDAAFSALVRLCTDICRRNNIPQLLWSNDKSLLGQYDRQNITIHAWTSKKSCPGRDILSKLGTLVRLVNENLNGKGDVLTNMTRQEFESILNTRIPRPIKYKFIFDVPEWAKPSVQKAIDKKYIAGVGQESGRTVLNLSEDFTRTLVVLDRAGLLDREM